MRLARRQVIVINEEMARRFWPNQDPVGKRLKYGLDPGAKNPWKTVVGVVADMRRQRLDEPAIPYMFQPGITREMDIAVRTLNDPDTSREAIRAEMRAIDPAVPPYGIVTVEQRLGRTVALRRLQTLLLAALAAVALVLAVIGAYGVIHQSVAARTQEIGVRMALGANAGAVLRMVIVGGMTPAAAGLVLGLLGSLMLSRTLSTFLYETNALDPLIYAVGDPHAAGGHDAGVPGSRDAGGPARSDAGAPPRVTSSDARLDLELEGIGNLHRFAHSLFRRPLCSRRGARAIAMARSTKASQPGRNSTSRAALATERPCIAHVNWHSTWSPALAT